ncbi:unnamed protein product [[Candida] boidinii]|nr:unnamed protein product [[Candida] boidinii]
MLELLSLLLELLLLLLRLDDELFVALKEEVNEVDGTEFDDVILWLLEYLLLLADEDDGVVEDIETRDFFLSVFDLMLFTFFMLLPLLIGESILILGLLFAVTSSIKASVI